MNQPHLHDVNLRDCDPITQRTRVSLLAMVSEISLFEDVFQNCLTGTIKVMDVAGLPDVLPLVCEEFIYLEYQAPQSPRRIAQILRVVKITDRTYPTEELTAYTLHVVSLELVINATQRISQSFRNQTASQIAEMLIRQSFPSSPKLLNLDIEPTTQRIDLMIPSMSPLQAINLCASRALSEQDHRANWLLWESTTGWHFRSLASLFSQKPVTTIDYVYANLATDDAFSKFRHAEQMTQAVGFDVLRNLTSGFYCSRVIMHDIIRGGYVVSDSTYLDEFGDHPHTVSNTAHPFCSAAQIKSVNPETQQFLVPANSLAIQESLIAGKDPSMKASGLEKVVEARFRQLVEIRQRVTELTLAGHPEVQAGCMVDVRYPTPRYRLDQAQSSQALYYKQPDRFVSGRHLVVAVRHILTAQDGHFKFRQRIEVAKDCLETAL